MPKGFPIGFEMAEKNVNRQTDIFVFIKVEIYTRTFYTPLAEVVCRIAGVDGDG